MQPNFDLISILMLVSAAHGFLLGLTLLSLRRGNRVANLVLAVALILFASGLTEHTLVYSRYILHVPHLAKTEPPLLFLIGPLFYFYVRALTAKTSRLNTRAALHALPALLCLLSLLPFYLLPASDKLHHLETEHQAPCLHCVLITWLFIVQLLVYLVASIRELLLHAGRIKESHSSLEKINFKWLQYLLVIFLAVWIVTLGIQLTVATPEAFNYAWLLVALVIFSIGYWGLRRPEVFLAEENLTAANGSSPKKKYQKSTLTAERADEYLGRLEKMMAKEKPFLDKELTLNRLAERLSLSSHHLSQIINERLQQNFFEFVNSHRVEEAKKLLLVPAKRHLNLSEIGFEAGFSSVSAFNAVFKKFTHMTPSRFQKESFRQGAPANI